MSIRISQLNQLTTITRDDFVPIVDSGSLTTFHTPISVVGSWFSDSGSVLSASWASQSLSSQYASASKWAISASYASGSVVAMSASWASQSLSSYYASASKWAVSSSYASGSSVAISASWASASLTSFSSVSASWASSSLISFSSSWASSSISASYAKTSSYAVTSSFSVTSSYFQSSAGGSSFPVAWANVLIPTNSFDSSDSPATVISGNLFNKPIILNGYNVSDISWCRRSITHSVAYLLGRPSNKTRDQTDAPNLLVSLTNPVSNPNYCIVGAGAETSTRGEGLSVAFYPFQPRTNTQFTMSMFGGVDWNGSWESVYFSFLVYS